MHRLMLASAALLVTLGMPTPSLAEPEVWLRPWVDEGNWSRDAAAFHPVCANDVAGHWTGMAAGGHTVPGSPSVYLQMETRNIGGNDQFPCEERFGPGAMCDDDRARVLDIRRTAAAPHPVTLRYKGRDRITRGRTAIMVRGAQSEQATGSRGRAEQLRRRGDEHAGPDPRREPRGTGWGQPR